MEKPDLTAINEAAQRLAGVAIRTPLLFCPYLSEQLKARVFLKVENLQHTGSFKFRGAYNAMAQIPIEKRSQGVVACSSGNHAQGVAEAGRLLGIKTWIVMPADAPEAKIVRTRQSGADTVFYDRNMEDRDEIAQKLVNETGATYIHPFENEMVIAGQGTTGLEVVHDLKASGHKLDIMLICTGGGGLTAGMALVCKGAYPLADIYAVEPEDFDDYGRSLNAGHLLANTKFSGSLCDALLTPKAGKLGFAINHNRLAGGLSVSDVQALAAVRFAYEQHRLVVEPGGAVALAALMFDKLPGGSEALADKTIVLILSGGNIDFSILQRALKA